jgi:hypothetical protein
MHSAQQPPYAEGYGNGHIAVSMVFLNARSKLPAVLRAAFEAES